MRDQIQDQRQKSAIICPAFQRGNFKFSSICLCCLCCVWPQWQANTELDRIPAFHHDQSFSSPNSFLSVVLTCSCGPWLMVLRTMCRSVSYCTSPHSRKSVLTRSLPQTVFIANNKEALLYVRLSIKSMFSD